MSVSPASGANVPTDAVDQYQLRSESLGDLEVFPAELLEKIFIHLGTTTRYLNADGTLLEERQGSFENWLNSTAVSREFRTIALIPAVYVAFCRQFGRLQEGLIFAIKIGGAAALKLIIDAGVTFAAPGGLSPLDFIGPNPKEILEVICREKILAFSDDECHKALCLAAEYGSLKVARLILMFPDVDVTKANQDGDTPFHLAAKGGHVDILGLLLNRNESEISLIVRQEAFILAASHGHAEAVDFLLTLPGITVSGANEADETALHFAVKGGSAEVVGSLLRKFGEELKKTVHYEKAFRLAAACGFHKIVALFLEDPELDVNTTDDWGTGVLQLAAKGNHFKTVKQLMQKRGSSFNTGAVEKAISCAGRKGFSNCLALLETLSKDINAIDEEGCTALHRATQNGKSETVELLLGSKGIDVNLEDNKDRTALFYAVELDDIGLVSLFLTKAISLLDKKVLEEALHLAVAQRYVDITRLLIALPEINVNAPNVYDDSVLIVAVGDGRPGMVELLVETRGDDFNKEDVERAFQMVAKSRPDNSKIEQLLRGLRIKEEVPVADEVNAAEEPQVMHKFPKSVGVINVLTKTALVASLILTTILAVLAIQGLLLPYSIAATAAAGTMSLILGIYVVYSGIARRAVSSN